VKKALLSGVVMAALFTAPLLADLNYSMRIVVRPVAVTPQDPAAADLTARTASMLRSILAGMSGAGAVESASLLGDRGWRFERMAAPDRPGPPPVVSIQRPDRSMLFLNTAARTYWTTPAAPAAPEQAFAPSLSITRTGSFDMVAGLKAERVDFEVVLKPVDPAVSDAMASDGVTLRLTGQAWVASEYAQYAELAFHTYRRPFGLPWLDQDLRKLGLVVRAVLRGDLLGGFEIEAVLTRVAEEAAPQDEFDAPAGFAQVQPPARLPMGARIVQPVPVTRVNPKYTEGAMRAKLVGVVGLGVVVLADGTVGDVTVTKSLDAEYGLDDRAVAAVRQWRFTPGTINGVPTKMHVTINLEFKLHF
jgi:TonB family protein